MQIEKNDNQIREISYSVYSLDGTETYDKGTLKSAESRCHIKAGKSLGYKIQEAVLQVSLAIGEEKETRKVNFIQELRKQMILQHHNVLHLHRIFIRKHLIRRM